LTFVTPNLLSLTRRQPPEGPILELVEREFER
jgi:hypothetical protein